MTAWRVSRSFPFILTPSTSSRLCMASPGREMGEVESSKAARLSRTRCFRMSCPSLRCRTLHARGRQNGKACLVECPCHCVEDKRVLFSDGLNHTTLLPRDGATTTVLAIPAVSSYQPRSICIQCVQQVWRMCWPAPSSPLMQLAKDLCSRPKR